MGYLVKLDTNGSDPDRLRAVLSEGCVDYVAMDVKSGPSAYSLAIGREMSAEPFLSSIRLLRESGIPYEFRTTLVKGIHREEDVEEMAELLAGRERYFLQGFRDSGNLLGTGVEAFTREEMAHFLAIVKKKVPEARIRGQEE